MATRASSGKGKSRKAAAASAVIAVDLAVLTVFDGDDGPVLGIVQVKRDGGGGWSLPGGYLESGEKFADAARRIVTERTGLRGVTPRQLWVSDPAERDGHPRVVSVAHIAGVGAGKIAESEDNPDVRVVPAESPGRLPGGQAEIVAQALEDVRSRYGYLPDPDGFLPDSFTLRDLRGVHEAVAGYELQRDTFRRAMEPSLKSTRKVTAGGRGRPAELFTRG